MQGRFAINNSNFDHTQVVRHKQSVVQVLVLYWLSVHHPPFQVEKQTVTVEGQEMKTVLFEVCFLISAIC